MNVEGIKRAAQGRWTKVLSQLLPEMNRILVESNSTLHHRCPLPGHEDENPSFRWDSNDERYYCSCGNGDGFDLVQAARGINFKSALSEVADVVGVEDRSEHTATTYEELGQAVEATRRQLRADAAHHWIYAGADGTNVLAVGRFDFHVPDKNGLAASVQSKTYRTFCLDGERWRKGSPKQRLPLYKLPAISNTDGTVYVCEGEACVESLLTVGVTATTSAHGSMSARKSDWSCLAGRPVVLVPDDDEAGETYIRDIVAIFEALPPDQRPSEVQICRLEYSNSDGINKGRDILDWFRDPAQEAVDDNAVLVERLKSYCRHHDIASDSFNEITIEDLLSLDLRPTWLVEQCLIAGQPGIIGGRSKSLKTSLACELVLSLATGTPWLNEFPTRRTRAGFFSGESGLFAIQQTLKQQMVAKGLRGADLDGRTIFSARLPSIGSTTGLQQLTECIIKHQLEVVLIDPVYLCLMHGADAQNGRSSSDLFAMGPLLLKVSDACLAVGCTPLLVHHCKKTGADNHSQPPWLDDLAMAGFTEFARQWLLLGRRATYSGDGRHKLWLRTGGSSGFGRTYGVDIDDGEIRSDFSGRTWQATVMTEHDAREQQRKARRDTPEAIKRNAEIDQKVIEALGQKSDGLTKYGIQQVTELSDSPVKKSLARLRERAFVKVVTRSVQGRQRCVYQLAAGVTCPQNTRA